MTPHADVTPREALVQLGASSAEAIAQVLEMMAPGQIDRGDVTVMGDDQPAFVNAQFPALASSVSYVDGVTGANVVLMSAQSARALAAAMGAGMGEDPDISEPGELTELELSAISEAANQMMGAAANAISLVLGMEVDISPPDTRVLGSAAEATDFYGKAPHATACTFTVAGHPCRLVQLIPRAFVSRVARAIDQNGEALAGDDDAPDAARELGIGEAIGGIELRVWAEIGRTKLPLGRTLEIPPGSVVELDAAADDPVDLYVNGLLFGRGSLSTTEDGEWAVRLLSLENPKPSEGAFL